MFVFWRLGVYCKEETNDGRRGVKLLEFVLRKGSKVHGDDQRVGSTEERLEISRELTTVGWGPLSHW